MKCSASDAEGLAEELEVRHPVRVLVAHHASCLEIVGAVACPIVLRRRLISSTAKDSQPGGPGPHTRFCKHWAACHTCRGSLDAASPARSWGGRHRSHPGCPASPFSALPPAVKGIKNQPLRRKTLISRSYFTWTRFLDITSSDGNRILRAVSGRISSPTPAGRPTPGSSPFALSSTS